jgi:carboxylate-amine ligase
MAATRFTLGVELEFNILDRQSFDLVSRAPQILEDVPFRMRDNFGSELYQSTIEVRSDVCSSISELADNLAAICRKAEELAESNGCFLLAASLHPTACFEEQRITDRPVLAHYIQEQQHIGRQLIANGLHIHVGVDEEEKAVQALNSIQAFLPLLLAASCSSPFWRGVDTGFHSFRTKLLEQLPTTGIYPYFRDWRHYRRELGRLKEMGLLLYLGDVMWDVRIHEQFDTLEVRVCDLPCRFSEIIALAACVQALVAELYGLKEDLGRLSYSLLKANKWQASRRGLNGHYLDPSRQLSRQKMSGREALILLLNELEQRSVKLASRDYLDTFNEIFSRGCASDFQREVYRRTGDFRQVMAATREQFWL